MPALQHLLAHHMCIYFMPPCVGDHDRLRSRHVRGGRTCRPPRSNMTTVLAQRVATTSLPPPNPTPMQSAIAKLTAALAYGLASLLIMFVNKFTLTVFSFPSFTFLAFAQCIASE